jgi:DNA-binding FrmR family transcriptional regulator
LTSHTVREKSKLSARVRRIRGQVEAIERALEAEAGCANVLQIIASVRGAVNGLMAVVVEDHIRCHVAAPSLATKRRAEGADDLVEFLSEIRTCSGPEALNLRLR